jgi:hypothetical protein
MPGNSLRRQQFDATARRYDSDLTKIAEAHQAYLAGSDALDQAVVTARRHGASWSEIANALGCTKQAAHERYRYL